MSPPALDDAPRPTTLRSLLTNAFHMVLALVGVLSAFPMLGLAELATALHDTTHRLRH